MEKSAALREYAKYLWKLAAEVEEEELTAPATIPRHIGVGAGIGAGAGGLAGLIALRGNPRVGLLGALAGTSVGAGIGLHVGALRGRNWHGTGDDRVYAPEGPWTPQAQASLLSPTGMYVPALGVGAYRRGKYLDDHPEIRNQDDF
jgi:hypothetical protein